MTRRAFCRFFAFLVGALALPWKGSPHELVHPFPAGPATYGTGVVDLALADIRAAKEILDTANIPIEQRYCVVLGNALAERADLEMIEGEGFELVRIV